MIKTINNTNWEATILNDFTMESLKGFSNQTYEYETVDDIFETMLLDNELQLIGRV